MLLPIEHSFGGFLLGLAAEFPPALSLEGHDTPMASRDPFFTLSAVTLRNHSVTLCDRLACTEATFFPEGNSW